ncbi:hypothetical protein QZQ24_05575 [Serratia marcescens]|uniref:hypothetical protein n=1 Tax=Serratia marcescens TaxID=615 RepID=UPI0027524FFE|nr:hypothetical protein [Serratia marcescens]MDP8639002.1 hypothetical protein [Serratia marcescens]MDP8832479.1 hypothetical protein [Serratia marcescens]
MESKAKLFNQQYAVGSTFIHQPNRALRGGPAVRTVDVARDLKSATVVEINVAPYFVNIESLTPAG